MQQTRARSSAVLDGDSPAAAAFFEAIDGHIARHAALFSAPESLEQTSSASRLAEPRRAAPRRSRSLWLDIATRAESYLFELTAGEERAIVVGSFENADVRIDDARVEPVELHFERDGDAVCVVPAYDSEIEVNAARLSGPRRIHQRAIVEFQGHVLRVRVLEDPRSLSLLTAPEWHHPELTAPAPGSEQSMDSEVTATRLAAPDAQRPASPAAPVPVEAASSVPRRRPAGGTNCSGTAVVLRLLVLALFTALGFFLGQLTQI